MAVPNLVVKRSQLFKFTSPEDVKLNTGLVNSISNDALITPIITSQDLNILPVLGSTLYNNLKTHFIAGNYDPENLPDGSTLPDNINYKELYYKMFPALCWWSAVHSLLSISVKVDDKGIMYNNSDYSSNGELPAYNQVNNKMTKIAESYTDNLLEYMKETFANNKDVVKESVPVGRKRFATIYDSDRNYMNNCNW